MWIRVRGKGQRGTGPWDTYGILGIYSVNPWSWCFSSALILLPHSCRNWIRLWLCLDMNVVGGVAFAVGLLSPSSSTRNMARRGLLAVQGLWIPVCRVVYLKYIWNIYCITHRAVEKWGYKNEEIFHLIQRSHVFECLKNTLKMTNFLNIICNSTK